MTFLCVYKKLMVTITSILRSLFISLFPFTALLVLIYTGISFFENDSPWGIAGTFLIAMSIVAFFSGLFIKPRARTDANLKLYSVLVAAGFVISLLVVLAPKHSNKIHLLLSLFLAVGWIVYLRWYSIFPNRENEGLQVGKQLETFQLEDLEKKSISSDFFLGNPSIFLFYRGNWCPLCMAQIKEIAGLYGELEKLGVNTVLISPQPHTHTKSLAEKFNVNFHFLVDYKNKVAEQLGILASNGIPSGFQVLGYDSDTVMPTVIITDKNGKIIFADLTDNYRLRPEPEVFLRIIRESITP